MFQTLLLKTGQKVMQEKAENLKRERKHCPNREKRSECKEGYLGAVRANLWDERCRILLSEKGGRGGPQETKEEKGDGRQAFVGRKGTAPGEKRVWELFSEFQNTTL